MESNLIPTNKARAMIEIEHRGTCKRYYGAAAEWLRDRGAANETKKSNLLQPSPKEKK